MKRRMFAIVLALVMILFALPVTGSASHNPFLAAQQQDQQPAAPDANANAVQQQPNRLGAVTPSTRFPHTVVNEAIMRWHAVNNDVKGWLLIPGTNMSMPIVQNMESNKFYEHRSIQGVNYTNINANNAPETATYLDYRVRFGEGWKYLTSRNIVVYGHNWNNLRAPFRVGNQAGLSMFAQLPSYTNAEFAFNNPHIYFSTPELEGIWRVFAAGYCVVSNDFFYNEPNPSEEYFQYVIDEWKARSVLNFGVEVDSSDRILTLSTCTRQYGSSDAQRYVVVARLLRPGETENDAVAVAVNPSPKQPKFN